MWGELHESKQIKIVLPETISAGKANRLFRELGATLHYDVYSFEAEHSEPWQSDLLHIELKKDESIVDAQEDFNHITAIYLLASRPSSDQPKALKLITKIITAFNAKATYQDCQFSEQSIQKDWDSCNDYLLKEWGEQPGSESLRIMIEENHA